MYTAAGLGYLFLIGEARKLGRLNCSIIAGIGSIPIGISLNLTIIPLFLLIATAVYLVTFYFTRSTIDYLIFCSLSIVIISLSILQYYWFLEFDFSGFSLQIICFLLIGVFALSLFIPANVFSPQRGIVMGLYAIIISGVEGILYFNSLDIYPYYMVIYTSAIGIFISYHLFKNKFINHITLWICLSSFISKLILIFSFHRGSLTGCFLLILCILSPYFIHYNLLIKNNFSDFKILYHGIGYTILYSLITFITIESVGGTILFTIIGKIPTVAMIWGLYLLLFGLECFVFWFYIFPLQIIARRIFSSFILIGFGLLLLDSEFGVFISYGKSSPLLFIFCVFITLICSQSRYHGVRLFYIISMSILCSILLVHTTLPSFWIFYITFFILFLSYFSILNLLSFPSSNSSKIIPILYGFFLLFFVIIFITSRFSIQSLSLRVQGEYYRQLKSSLGGLCAGLSIFLSIIIKLKLSSSMNNENVKLKTPNDPMKWIPEICNISAIIAYCFSSYFCLFTLGHTESSLFLLAPILLLLVKVNILLFFFLIILFCNKIYFLRIIMLSFGYVMKIVILLLLLVVLYFYFLCLFIRLFIFLLFE